MDGANMIYLQHPWTSHYFWILLREQSIRYYQRLTDDMVDLWHRGSRFDEIRLYVEGYLACLRDSNSIEPYLIHRLEEEIFRFLRDPSNFEYLSPQTQTQTEADYGYY